MRPYFARAFEAVQTLVKENKVLAGHDISAGGLITALLEMTFADNTTGISVDLDALNEKDIIKAMFSEKPAILLQVKDAAGIKEQLSSQGIDSYIIGEVNLNRKFTVKGCGTEFELLQDHLRDTWFKTSYLLDRKQAERPKEPKDSRTINRNRSNTNSQILLQALTRNTE